jgi:hypothetical protein
MIVHILDTPRLLCSYPTVHSIQATMIDQISKINNNANDLPISKPETSEALARDDTYYYEDGDTVFLVDSVLFKASTSQIPN